MKKTTKEIRFFAVSPLLFYRKMLPTYNMSKPVDTTTAPLIDNQQGVMTSSYPQPDMNVSQVAPTQAVPVQTMPAQPYPGQIPTQPIPTQPIPGQPIPTQPYPGQAYPAQPMPGQPIPVQPIPVQPMPGIPVQPTPMGNPLEQLMNCMCFHVLFIYSPWYSYCRECESLGSYF